MSFERVVRPYQTDQFTLPRTVPPPSGQVSQLVKVQAGRGAGGKTFHGSYSFSVTVYNKKYPKETETDE